VLLLLLMLLLLLPLVDKARLPPLELSMVFRSFDSTLSELPVDNLVMVTEPDEEEVELGVLFVVVFIGDEDIIIDDDEEDEDELLAPDLHNSVSLVLEEDDLTGEMVTLLLLLSFF
jgi:hypothetical protein